MKARVAYLLAYLLVTTYRLNRQRGQLSEKYPGCGMNTEEFSQAITAGDKV